MRASRAPLPDATTLAGILDATLAGHGSPTDPVTILSRRRNPRASTYPSEVVHCRSADGSELRLLCKYAAGHSHGAYGQRAGVEYEAQVYRRVLAPLSVSKPGFYGLYKNPDTGVTCMILEYLDESVVVKESRDRTLMQAAARWLGEFHRSNESSLTPAAMPFIREHAAQYYRGWADRTSLFADDLHAQFQWLATLCQRFEEVVATLVESPRTVIHGEYYPNNVLFRRGTIYPVDWESAAVALAEIDLASLIEGWPAETARLCKAEYRSARGIQGSPADFERKLGAAQLYWSFRWLGERRDWTQRERALRRFARLKDLGERFGLI